MIETLCCGRPLAEIGAGVALVGDRDICLGETYRELSSQGIAMPNGLATMPGAGDALYDTRDGLETSMDDLGGAWR